MTPKQILDSFSETLMRDNRILSAPERALVATLLQHAKAASDQSPETQEAVRAVIASAVGETVAQRAFAVLGGSIVERIVENSAFPLGEPLRAMPEPQPPSGQPGPGGPGVRAPHKEPHKPMRDTPLPPAPKEPQPPSVGPGPHGVRTTVVSETSAAVAERPAKLQAQCVVLDEFLAPQELQALTRFTLEHEADFSASEVVSPDVDDGGVVNYEHRRSRVLMDLAQHQDVMLERIKTVLPQVLDKLGMEEFSIAGVEVQVTASNDGDFFHFHCDNGSDRVAARHLTFVYFFHREPRQFEGGELRIHDAGLEEGRYVSQGSYQTIVPRQNQIVFFPCELLHEITPVNCASLLFADSRFTLNGWLRR
jgi:Rps23 Pro-64 3,4-dihydroxylase Tpa1-like proline 4-hydroxylase